ncbi:MAG: ATP-binding protein [Bacteroidales bacterium]
MQRIGLITRIALLVMAIEVAAFSALGWFYIDRFSTAAEDRVRAQIRQVGKMIASSEMAVSAISAPNVISNLVNAPYVGGAVIGGSGRVIAALDAGYLGRPAGEVPGISAAWFAPMAPAYQIVTGPETLTSVFNARAAGDGPAMYSIVITVSTSALEADKRSIALWGWLVSAAFVVVSSAGIVLVAHRLITRRIDTSLAALKKVENGNLHTRIPVSSHDELGQLQHGINSMIASIATLLLQHRRNEEEMATILDSIADGVIAVGANGDILRSNPSALGLVGATLQPPGWSNIATVLPELAPEDGTCWWLSPNSLSAHGRIKIERPAPDGTARSIEVGHGPICEPDGTVIGAVLVLQDVTVRQKAERELRLAVERLTVSNAELERFAYVASHDLQEPLRSITSFTQLLERRLGDGLTADNRELFGFVIAAAKRMSLLISDLLAYSRVNTKGVQFNLVPLKSSCESALDNLRETISETQAEIVIEPLPEVFGDAVQLMQLFQNLIGNALKFHRPDTRPQVTVASRRGEDEWVVSVADNGIGIEATQQDIFEIFRRLHTTESYPGSGVGLAICKRIVQRHSGRIWFESRAGEGATFYFTLPLRAEPQPGAAP